MKQLFIVLVLIALTSCATHRGNVIGWENDLQIGYADQYLTQFSINKLLSINEIKLNDQQLIFEKDKTYPVRVVSTKPDKKPKK